MRLRWATTSKTARSRDSACLELERTLRACRVAHVLRRHTDRRNIFTPLRANPLEKRGIPPGTVDASPGSTREVDMKYLVTCMLAALWSSPLTASAQNGDAESSPMRLVLEPAPEEPSLQLEVGAAGVESGAPRTVDGYTLEKLEDRVDRARNGLIASSAVLGVGVVLLIAGGVTMKSSDFWESGGRYEAGRQTVLAGTAIGIGGLIGTAASGIILRSRKQALRKLQPRDERPSRLQWGLAQLRLAF
jgi:hypothetical protein